MGRNEGRISADPVAADFSGDSSMECTTRDAVKSRLAGFSFPGYRSSRRERGERSERERSSYEGSAPGANGLGLASIAIGLAEIAAPAQVQSLLGLRDHPEHRGILRILGIREILHGVSILIDKDDRSRQKVGVWSRVAGDMLDTALLGIAAQKTENPTRFAAVSTSVLIIGVLDMLSAMKE
jgi:hypothetical protein